MSVCVYVFAICKSTKASLKSRALSCLALRVLVILDHGVIKKMVFLTKLFISVNTTSRWERRLAHAFHSANTKKPCLLTCHGHLKCCSTHWLLSFRAAEDKMRLFIHSFNK